MNNFRNQIHVSWAIGMTLLGGLVGGALVAAHLGAAPLDVPDRPTVSPDGPVVQSADYVDETLTLYTLRNFNGDPDATPILLVSAMVEIEVIFPGASAAREMDVPGLMYIQADDLAEFPGAMMMVNREEGISFDRIDTINRERGLAQLRLAYKKAHGHEPKFSAPNDVDAEPAGDAESG